MLNTAVSFTVYIIEMLISYVFFAGMAKKKMRAVFCLLIGAALFSAGSILNLIFENIFWINALATFTANFAFAMLCFDFRFGLAAFYALILDLTNGFAEYIVVLPVSLLTKTMLTSYNSNFSILCIETAISKTLYFVIIAFLIRFRRKRRGDTNIHGNFFIYPLTILLTYVAIFYFTANTQLGTKTALPLDIVVFMLIISVIVLYISYQHSSEREKNYIASQNESGKQQTESEYYSLLQHQNEELMTFAHDTKKHLRAIADISGDPEVIKYISSISESLDSCTELLHSGNKTLDVIISRYDYTCKRNGIGFTYDILESNLNFMDESDLVALLDNLLDNAVAAAARSGNKSVFLETRRREMTDAVIIKNSTASEVKIIDRLPVFRTNGIHGYGIKSVQRTARKYNGEYSCKFDRGNMEFTAYVYMMNRQDS